MSKFRQLVEALGTRGLILRSDSTLCRGWLEGDTNKSLDEVVEIMYKMKVVYEKVIIMIFNF